MNPLGAGLAEALHYTRRPIAVLQDRQDPDVLTRWAPAERVDGDNPALSEVFLRYDHLVVCAFTGGSPLMKYPGDRASWARFAGAASTKLLPATAAPAGPAREGTLHIDGQEHQTLTSLCMGGYIVRMAVLRDVVVAVTGAPDAVDRAVLRLEQPERELLTAVFLGGRYPRYTGSGQGRKVA